MSNWDRCCAYSFCVSLPVTECVMEVMWFLCWNCSNGISSPVGSVYKSVPSWVSELQSKSTGELSIHFNRRAYTSAAVCSFFLAFLNQDLRLLKLGKESKNKTKLLLKLRLEGLFFLCNLVWFFDLGLGGLQWEKQSCGGRTAGGLWKGTESCSCPVSACLVCSVCSVLQRALSCLKPVLKICSSFMRLHYKCFTTTLVTACFFPCGTLLKKAEDIGVSCMWLAGMW